MHRPHLARILPLLVLAELVQAHRADAQSGTKDDEALALDREAIVVDYLAIHLDTAKAKLQSALKLCEDNACSPRIVAILHRDLGVVYAAGYKQHGEAVVEFTQALTADASIQLDPDLVTDETRAAFNEAAATLGITVATEPPPVDKKAPAISAQNLLHAPPAEQRLNTPVPLYLDPPRGVTFDKVKVRYRSFGVTEWKSADLERLGRGWGGEIPCADVSTTGDLEYYIQAYDASGDVDTQSGSRQKPHRVPIVNQLRGAPPRLPGRPSPSQCREANDCPPDFPGCGSSGALPPPILRPIERPLLRNWFSLVLEQNFLLLGTATGVCNPGSDYDCFDPDGRPFETTVLDEGGGEVVTGIVPATIRILAGYERVFGRRFSAGGRVGFAFGGAPGVDGDDFFPFVGELRAAYFLGRDPLAKRGFRPFVSGALGVAQVDAKVAVNVFANEGAAQTGNVTEVEAWRKTGLIFAAAGVGTAFAVADTQALLAEVRVIQSFGMMGTGLSLNIGYTLGI